MGQGRGAGAAGDGNKFVKRPCKPFCSYALLTNVTAPDAQRSATRNLRPSAKVLPEHARGHNRSLVLQNLYRGGLQSRADLARETGLTRVTISDLVAELIADDLVIETDQRDTGRPGKPAVLLDINRDGHRIIGVDLSDTGVFRGAVLDFDGTSTAQLEVETDGVEGAEATALLAQLVTQLAASADLPILGVGVGTPGIVDLAGTVLSAPTLGGSTFRCARSSKTPPVFPLSSPTTQTPPHSPNSVSATRSVTTCLSRLAAVSAPA